MIRPNSFDAKTVSLLRRLVTVTCARRDDLYAAANQLRVHDLAAICRKLADDLAGDSAYLRQIIAIHGQDPAGGESSLLASGEEAMQRIQQEQGDQGVVSAIEDEQGDLCQRYAAAIAAIQDPEARAILEVQQRNADFAERVLRQIAAESKNRSRGHDDTSIPDSPH